MGLTHNQVERAVVRRRGRDTTNDTIHMRRIALVLAVGLPVRAEPSWHDPVLKKLGVNYTTYVANQVKKFDGHQHLNSDGGLDMDFLTKKD